MPHVTPLPREELSDFEPGFRRFEQTAGFVPRSMLTMGRRPELLRGFQALSEGAMAAGTLERSLKRMIALVASTAAGCRYCQAHTAATSLAMGVPADKVAGIWEFESSEQFDDAERAALRIARDAAQVPNAVTEAHFDDLRRFYNDGEIVEIVGVISFFGFLNRWNDTMATALEPEPLEAATRHLGPGGWTPGRHA
jgi:uncharacterized peroxidase-related enzyme